VVDKKGLLTGIFQVFQTKTWFAENYALLTQEQKDTLVIDLEQEVDKYLCDEFYSDEQELLIAVYNRLAEFGWFVLNYLEMKDAEEEQMEMDLEAVLEDYLSEYVEFSDIMELEIEFEIVDDEE